MTQLLTRPSMTDTLAYRAPAALSGSAWEEVSAKYLYIPTSGIVNKLEEEGFTLTGVQQSRTRIPGKAPFSKHRLTFTVPQDSSIVRKLGDSIPQIQLLNSHDRSSSLEVRRSIKRLICLNGMTSGGPEEFFKYPHRGAGHTLDDILGDVFSLVEGFGSLTTRVQAMQAKILEPWQQSGLAAQAAELRWGDKAPVTPAQLLTARRHADQGSDVWSTFNRIQENLVRGGQGYVAPRTDGRPARGGTTRAIKSIDADLKINGGLWNLAEALVA